MKDFPRKAQFPLLFASAAAPLAALLLAFAWPDALGRVLAVPALYALLAMPCLLVPGRRRLAAGLLAAAALLALGGAALDAGTHPGVMAVPAGFAAMLLLGLRMAAWPHDKEPPTKLLIAGALAHALLQFVVNVSRRNGAQPELLAAAPSLLACFWLFLLLGMLSLGRSALSDANWGRQRAPFSVRAKNTLLTVGFWALTLLLSMTPAVLAALRRAWALVSGAALALARALANLLPEGGSVSGGGPGGGMPDFSGLAEAAEPSALAVLLERITMAVALVASLALAAVLLRAVVRKLLALARTLLGRLDRFAAVSSEDYVDEITDTRESGETRAVLPRMNLRLVRESGLPPRERIRSRYARLRGRHPAWTDASTARETLPDGAARLYERARYSGHEMTREDAERFERESRD